MTTGMRHTHFRIFESVLDFQFRKQNRMEFFVYKNYSFLFVSFGAKHRGFGCRNIDLAGSSASITSKSLNNKERNVKTRKMSLGPEVKETQSEKGRNNHKSRAP
jgi:hypothetical protein